MTIHVYFKNEAYTTKLRTTYAHSQALIIINDVDDDSLVEFFHFLDNLLTHFLDCHFVFYRPAVVSSFIHTAIAVTTTVIS